LGATVYVLPQGLGGGGTEGLQVIKVPTSALRRDGNTSAVWVLDKASMTVRSQTVQIATADGNDAVIAAGLQPGMLVVTAGVHVLSPGQKVSIYQEKMPSGQENRGQTAINSGANNAAAVKLAASAPGSGVAVAQPPVVVSAPK
jgi:multidrug efflux system membrane fusion protein